MDIKSAVNVWEMRRISGVQMPRGELLTEFEDFVSKRANCALATGSGTYVRNTPMRYSYRAGRFYLFTEGGFKFKGLQANPNVCLAIYDPADTSSITRGVTVEGEAVVSEYKPDANANNSTAQLFMITITPRAIDYLNPDFEKKGYYQLQRLQF